MFILYRVLIVKLTNIHKDILDEVKKHLLSLGFDVNILTEINHLNASYFNWERRQYNASKILDSLVKKYSDFPYDSIVGIGDIDAYVEGLNFVFGLSTKKVGTVFLARLRNEFYGKECDMKLFIERVKKEVTHELGHTLGLGHCPNPSCVMSFSNSIEEVDRKTPYFCDKCRAKLNINYKS